MEVKRRKVHKNSAETFLDRRAKLIHRVFCLLPSLSSFFRLEVLMCYTKTCYCGTGHLLSVHHPEQVPHELPQDSRTISTLVRPSFLTESHVVNIVAATEHLLKHRIVFLNLKPETVLSNAKGHPKNIFDYQKLIHDDWNNYMKMETCVINIDGITDRETVNDFGCEPSDEYQYNYMMFETSVITVDGNIDSETLNDFGCEPSDGYQYNYMTIETSVITVDGNIDGETMHDLGCEPFAENQYNNMKLKSGMITAADDDISLSCIEF